MEELVWRVGILFVILNPGPVEPLAYATPELESPRHPCHSQLRDSGQLLQLTAHRVARWCLAPLSTVVKIDTWLESWGMNGEAALDSGEGLLNQGLECLLGMQSPAYTSLHLP